MSVWPKNRPNWPTIFQTEPKVSKILSETQTDWPIIRNFWYFTEKNLRCLGEYGRLVQIAFLKGQFPKVDLMQIMKQRLVITGSTLRARSDKEKKRIADQLKKNIWPEIESGNIKPCLNKEYQLSEINEAHEFMENSMHMGKIAVTIS